MTARLLLVVVGLFAGILSLFVVGPAHAEEGDKTELAAQSSRIGEQHRLVIQVVAPADATVELQPGGEGWNGVEVIRIANTTVTPQGPDAVHRMELVVAPFQPGQQTFTPVVNIVRGAEVTPRALPAVTWEVVGTLAADAPLELSPLPDPVAIGGAEPAWLRPLIAVGVAAGVLLLAGISWFAVRWLLRRRPTAEPGEVAAPPAAPSLGGAEALIEHDPVKAYRALAASVRGHIGRHYGFPAHALTTGELERRMESHGVDRWQARLVSGLLEECDSVVYAGYRPAIERRHADLNMAREIVGVE